MSPWKVADVPPKDLLSFNDHFFELDHDWRSDAAEAIADLQPRPTEDQQDQIWNILAWFFDDLEPFGLLAAPAGTGKTFTLGAVLSVLSRVIGRVAVYDTVILSAPTHRALRVIRNKLEPHALGGVNAFTCARLTGMKASTCLKSGKEVFKPQGTNALRPSTQLVVIDEASMINKEMHDILRDLVLSRGIRCLLIGDPCQLPPVKERMNPFFTSKGIKRFELTQVVRHDGPILEAATKTREMSSGRPVFKTVGDGSELFATHDRLVFHRMLREAFTDVDHAAPDHVQALAWTNKRVEELNRQARFTLYGKEAPQLVEGELLISTNPIYEGGTNNSGEFLCPTSTYLRVMRLEETDLDTAEWLHTFDPEPKQPFPIIRLIEVTAYAPDLEDTESEGYVRFHVVHEDDKSEFQSILDQVKKVILAKPEGGRRSLWRDNYYPLKNWDAPIQSACAMTTHRAQGTTLDTVFIDLQDMDRSAHFDDGEFLNRIVYTALTRASKRVVILDPKASSL